MRGTHRPVTPEATETWRLGPGDVAVADCEVVGGSATVDQSALTGESAAVVRESRPGHQVVLAGSRILTGSLIVRRLSPPIPHAPRARWLVRWWPAMALVAAGAAWLATRSLSAPLAWLGLVPLLPPYLLLLSSTATAGVQDTFWRAHRTIPLDPDACELAAACDTLVLPDGAVWENGRLSAADFWPLPGVSVRELAAAARQASLLDEGGPRRSVVILAKRTGVRDAPPVRAPHCGTVKDVAAEVARQGGLWPGEAAHREREIAARGGASLAVADGGRPLGLVELRPAGSLASLDDVLRAGIALVDVASPEEIDQEVGQLRAQGRRVALVLEPQWGEPQPQGGFVLGGLGLSDRRPTALDLDCDPGKLPALLLGARRVRRRCRSLRWAGGVADGLRALSAILLLAGLGRAGHEGVPGFLLWVSLPALALALLAGGLPHRLPR